MSSSNREILAHQLDGGGEEVVLLLNGGLMTYAAWGPIAEDLRRDHRVLGCDFRGQLRTPGESHRRLLYNVPDVVELLDALELDRVHVLGTSFGGEIGLLLAALHPERVRSLAAVTAADRSPPGIEEDSRIMQEHTRRILAGGSSDPFHERLVRNVYSRAYRERHTEALAARRQRSDALPRSWYEGLFGIFTSIEDFDLGPWLGRIRCRTLVVHAAHDEVMPVERVRALAENIPGAELRIHPESGHVLVVEDPLWLLRTYRQFLEAEPWTRRSSPAGC